MNGRPKKRISIRRSLFRWLLLPLVGLMLLMAAVGYPIALYPATAAYDWVLLDTAHSLSRLIEVRRGRPGLVVSSAAEILLRTDEFDRIYYSAHDASGNLIAGDGQLRPPSRETLLSGKPHYDSMIDGEPVRVAVLRFDEQGVSAVVQVAETTVKRHRLVRRILTGVIFIEVLLLCCVVVLVWFGISKGLEPMQQLREEIARRSYRDLQPVREEQVPEEMHSVVRALNDLLQQLGGALRSQQQFVANAAHQLRTPLAGLRMQVEYGLQQNDAREWRCALETLASTTERTVRLVNQLLTLAKAEVDADQLGPMRPFDMRDVAEQAAEAWMPKAIAREIDLGLELGPAPAHGDALLMGELLANLLDNAISYTPAGGRVTVRSALRGGVSVLEVEDDGPGIPEEERDKVFGRFYRVSGSPGEGCGLGLSIVREIARLHQGDVEIQSPPGGCGTIVTVSFRAPGPAKAGT